jgi:RHS repeat-associated protein
MMRGMYYHASVQNPANWVQRWTYKYQSGTSKLVSIDSSNTSLRTYAYDANGNTRTDVFRGLTSTTMNRANLPVACVVDGEAIKNSFDVLDLRIYKENVSTGAKTFYWLSGSGAALGVLTQVNGSWAQGVWEFYAGTAKVKNGERHFSVSDVNGNTRVVYHTNATCSGTSYVLDQVNDYYPFGKSLREFVNERERYTFNGNEREEESGLDYFNARYYDADVCRFFGVDPIVKWHESGYAAFGNNPIYYTDPSGLDASGGTNPNGGSTGMPNSGVSQVWYNAGSTNTTEQGSTFNVVPGSVIAFTYKGVHFVAYFNVNTGKFMKYGSKLYGGMTTDEFDEFKAANENPQYIATGDVSNISYLRVETDMIPAAPSQAELGNNDGQYGFTTNFQETVRAYAPGLEFVADFSGWSVVVATGFVGGAEIVVGEALVSRYASRGAVQAASRGASVEANAAANIAAKGGVQYTKSSLQLGQQMHKAYKVGANGVKEFRLPSGRRIDFLDIKNRTIYELKPFNPRAMQAGQKQLQMYMQELQTMPQFKGINWKTVLDTY